MRRRSRFLGWAVIVAYLSSSCAAYKTRALAPADVRPDKKRVVVVAATLTSGERFEYPEKTPATVNGQDLCATASWRVALHVLPRSQVREPRKFKSKWPRRIVTTDGRTFDASRVVSWSDEEVRFETRTALPPPADTVVELAVADVVRRERGKDDMLKVVGTRDGREFHHVRLLSEEGGRLRLERTGLGACTTLSGVQQLVVREPDSAKQLLYTFGGLLGLAIVGTAIMIATKESCPFVYSFDGRRYVFDAEPYGGAIAPGLKRAEWCELEHLRESGGRYRLLLANEVDETQHTDELRLVVVDHPPGTRVVADEAGALHLVSRPQPPASARDRLGRDLLPLVTVRDLFAWESRLSDAGGAWDEALREELTFEFPKPAGARRARLLVDGRNTLWGSQMLKRFLDLHGREVGAWYALVNGSPQARQRIEAWSLREETYRLQLRVETPEGWPMRGALVGGGPFQSEERVYEIDVADVPGERVRLRLRPPAGFWSLNSIAVDYGDERALEARELAPLRAVDGSGADVREALLATDDRYVSMPRTGDRAEIDFPAQPRRPGLERSFLVKVSGYYDIHLAAVGEPQREILARYTGEPGFAARYALEEYRRFVAQQLASARP